jgi:hypothetical protein
MLEQSRNVKNEPKALEETWSVPTVAPLENME